MSNIKFEVPTKKSVNKANREILEKIESGVGFIPNIYATYAHSNNALGRYTTFANGKTSLNNKEKEVINLVVSQVNGCTYCLAAHTAIGKMNGFSSNISDLIDAANFLAAEYQFPSLLIGHSFGGAASIFAAQFLPDIKALATIASPSNTQHISHLFEDHLDTIKEKGVSMVHIGGRAFGINHSFLQDLKEKDLGSCLSQ